MPSLTYDFSSSSSMTLTNVDVTGGKAQLSTARRTNRPYDKTFDVDTGITYSPFLTEFTGSLVRQKDRAGSNCTFLAMFTSSKDAEFSAGSATGTLGGNAAISGGDLVLDGTGDYETFAAASNADFTQAGTIRARVSTNYSGTPSTTQCFFAISNAANNANYIALSHVATSGKIFIVVSNSVGGGIVYGYPTNTAWNPTAGVKYEFELNIDVTTGETRLFIDGVQWGSTQTGTGTRNTSVGVLALGCDYDGGGANYTNTLNGIIHDIAIFSAVQHTTSYTVDGEPTYRYMRDAITSAPAPKDGLGPFLSFNSFSCVSSGSVRFSINGKYWDGAAWTTSDGTWAQLNTAAELNTNLPTLDTTGMTTCSVIGMGNNSNSTQSSVTSISITYDTLGYVDTGSILFAPVYAESITSVAATVVDASYGVGSVKFAVQVNGVLKYWNGSAWVNSDGTYSQAATLADTTANTASLVSSNSTVRLYAVFGISTYVAFTPTLDDISFTYDFGGVVVASDTTLLWGYVKDPSGTAISGATVTLTPIRDSDTPFKHADSAIVFGGVSTTTNGLGYFETNVIISSEYETLTRYTCVISKDSVSYTGTLTLVSANTFYNLSDVIILG